MFLSLFSSLITRRLWFQISGSSRKFPRTLWSFSFLEMNRFNPDIPSPTFFSLSQMNSLPKLFIQVFLKKHLVLLAIGFRILFLHLFSSILGTLPIAPCTWRNACTCRSSTDLSLMAMTLSSRLLPLVRLLSLKLRMEYTHSVCFFSADFISTFLDPLLMRLLFLGILLSGLRSLISLLKILVFFRLFPFPFLPHISSYRPTTLLHRGHIRCFSYSLILLPSLFTTT